MSTELDGPALGQLRFRALDEIAKADAAIAAAEGRRAYWRRLLASLRPGEWVALAGVGDFKAADVAPVQDAAAEAIAAFSGEIASLREEAAEDRERLEALACRLGDLKASGPTSDRAP